jgi:RNA polymerase sigma-70 factor (ECF subfamily)
LPEDVRELVDRCLAGHESAAFALVERFQDRVFSLCYRMLGHRQDAEDVTQESLVRAIGSLRSFDRTRDFIPWLLAIAGNRCRTLLATRMRRPTTSVPLEHVPDHTPDLDGVRNLSEEVELALGRLRPEYRQAFVLFHEQELSYAEIAAAMRCPLGTVKTWVHRARRELIAALRERGVLEESRHALQGL